MIRYITVCSDCSEGSRMFRTIRRSCCSELFRLFRRFQNVLNSTTVMLFRTVQTVQKVPECSEQYDGHAVQNCSDCSEGSRMFRPTKMKSSLTTTTRSPATNDQFHAHFGMHSRADQRDLLDLHSRGHHQQARRAAQDRVGVGNVDDDDDRLFLCTMRALCEICKRSAVNRLVYLLLVQQRFNPNSTLTDPELPKHLLPVLPFGLKLRNAKEHVLIPWRTCPIADGDHRRERPALVDEAVVPAVGQVAKLRSGPARLLLLLRRHFYTCMFRTYFYFFQNKRVARHSTHLVSLSLTSSSVRRVRSWR